MYEFSPESDGPGPNKSGRNAECGGRLRGKRALRGRVAVPAGELPWAGTQGPAGRMVYASGIFKIKELVTFIGPGYALCR